MTYTRKYKVSYNVPRQNNNKTVEIEAHNVVVATRRAQGQTGVPLSHIESVRLIE